MAVQETDGRQTAMRIDMNSDMGESFGRWKLGDDEALLDVVSSANVACGFHAGDPSVMLRTLSYAASREVMVGVHVAYRDLAGFGRRYVDESPDELKADVMYQIAALEGMARSVGAQVRYVKPHGALYNRIVRDESQAAAVVDAIRAVDASLAILTQPGAVVGRLAAQAGLRVFHEAFADRAYNADGTLVSRRLPDAVIADPAEVAARVLRMVRGWRSMAPWCRSTPIPSVCMAIRPRLWRWRVPSAPAWSRKALRYARSQATQPHRPRGIKAVATCDS